MLSRADCIGLVLWFLSLASCWRCALGVLRSMQSLGSACQTHNCSESPPRLHEHAKTSCDAARYTTCYICSVLEGTASGCPFGVLTLAV